MEWNYLTNATGFFGWATTVLQQAAPNGEPGIPTDWYPGVLMVVTVFVLVVWRTRRKTTRQSAEGQHPAVEKKATR